MLPFITNMTMKRLFDHGFSIHIQEDTKVMLIKKYELHVMNPYLGDLKIYPFSTITDTLITASFLYLEMMYKKLKSTEPERSEDTFNALRNEGLTIEKL